MLARTALHEVSGELLELRTGQRFSECIGQLVCCGDICHVDLVGASEFAHVVVAKIDVAAAFEIDWVFGLLNASCVVFIDECWFGVGITEFVEQHLSVDKAASCFECGIEFRFGR